MKIADDVEFMKNFNNLKQLQQRQYSLNDQLYFLKLIANKFGLYDAGDLLLSIIKEE